MNKTNIIAQMRAVAKAAEIGNYVAKPKDILTVGGSPEEWFPLIWQCGVNYDSSHVYSIGQVAHYSPDPLKTLGVLWDSDMADELYFIIDVNGLHKMTDAAALKKAVSSALELVRNN